jgi:hypothetical protein
MGRACRGPASHVPVKDFLRRIGIRFETPFESPSGLTRRPDPGYLRDGEKRETTLIQSGGGPGPAKPQQPAREGAVLIPTRATLEGGPRKMRIARW